jgi:murein DD-endopeptidase MepM/ murein hydrolase activator NlpD
MVFSTLGRASKGLGLGRDTQKKDNEVITRDNHVKAVFVNVGDVVQQSRVIATFGSPGGSIGHHLHYELIRGGNTVNAGLISAAH